MSKMKWTQEDGKALQRHMIFNFTKSDIGSRQAMKTLHNKYRFDYNKPIMVKVYDGTVTAKRIEKEFGINYKTHEIVGFISYLTEDGYKNPSLFEVTYDGKIAHNNAFESHWTIADFEEKRKCTWTKALIIAQAREHLSKPKKAFDGREDYERHEQRRYGCFLYATNIGDYVYRDYMDKSGYNVNAFRNELEARAKSNRAKREKKEYLAKDFSTDIANLENCLKALQRHLAEEFANAKSLKDFRKCEEKIANYSGFVHTFSEFTELKEMEERKAFSSVSEFNNKFAYIEKRIFDR